MSLLSPFILLNLDLLSEIPALSALCLTWISALNKTTRSSEQMWPHDLLMASGRVVWLGGEGSSARLAPAFWLDCFLAVFSRGRCEAADDWFSRRTNGQRRLKRVQRKSKWQKHKEEHKRQLEGRRRRSNTKNTHLSYWDQNMKRYDNNLCCFSSNEFTTSRRTEHQRRRHKRHISNVSPRGRCWLALVTCDQMENDVDHQKKLNIGAVESLLLYRTTCY